MAPCWRDCYNGMTKTSGICPGGARALPYAIWLSEVMLQQTRVETARGYWERFLSRFADVAALAAAQEQEVLKLWEGLGYYSRARNLLKCARMVCEHYGGRFPQTAAELRKLPGIGEYTAGAVASIAFDERVAAVDGNVERVLTRVLGIREELDIPSVRRRLREEAAALVPPKRPGDFNQALMELGACVCLPCAAVRALSLAGALRCMRCGRCGAAAAQGAKAGAAGGTPRGCHCAVRRAGACLPAGRGAFCMGCVLPVPAGGGPAALPGTAGESAQGWSGRWAMRAMCSPTGSGRWSNGCLQRRTRPVRPATALRTRGSWASCRCPRQCAKRARRRWQKWGCSRAG